MDVRLSTVNDRTHTLCTSENILHDVFIHSKLRSHFFCSAHEVYKVKRTSVLTIGPVEKIAFSLSARFLEFYMLTYGIEIAHAHTQTHTRARVFSVQSMFSLYYS